MNMVLRKIWEKKKDKDKGSNTFHVNKWGRVVNDVEYDQSI